MVKWYLHPRFTLSCTTKNHLNIKTLTPNQLIKAQQRISVNLLCTPIIASTTVDIHCNAEVFFKCENLQRTGSFKVRGAFNAILSYSADQLKHGVATHSSGNHAQALALAAKTFGVKSHIVMPYNSPEVKINGVKEHGGVITLCDPTLAAREIALNRIIKKTGAIFIPPYDHPEIICGQSTVTQEIFRHANKPIDVILAPLGGGGLLSGTGLAAHFFSPNTKVYGAEPENVNDGQRSFRSGKLEHNAPQSTTMADGLKTHLSDLTLGYIRNHVCDIFTVSESAIAEAMLLIWQSLKVIVEPSAAVPLAALIQQKHQFKDKRVALIVSGGNVDLNNIPFMKPSTV